MLQKSIILCEKGGVDAMVNFEAKFSTTYGVNIKDLFPSIDLQAIAKIDVTTLVALRDKFMNVAQRMSPWDTTKTVTYAAMPDYRNAGWLDVDKNTNTVFTPGGWEIRVKDGQVQVKAPNGKWTTLKAEPPTRTVTDTKTVVERVLPRDPVVRESDGAEWRYQGTGTFILPDGTKITIQEVGEGKDLHISQVDIYNGNKHVAIKSELVSSKWQTVRTETDVSRRWEGRRLLRTTTVTKHQEAVQKFRTTISDVMNDGWRADAAQSDGVRFRAAGDGDDWTRDGTGREVIGSGSKTEAFRLGDALGDSTVGEMGLIIPWRVNFSVIDTVKSEYSNDREYFDRVANRYIERFQGKVYHGMIEEYSGFQIYSGGTFGGAVLFGDIKSEFPKIDDIIRYSSRVLEKLNVQLDKLDELFGSLSKQLLSTQTTLKV
jgi:hypothetical protein